MARHPYVGQLTDGRYFTVELPEGAAERDSVTNELILQPAAIHLLDGLRVLLSPMPAVVTAGRLRLFRQVLNWSIEELANELHEDVAAVQGWELNQARPDTDQRAKLEAIRQRVAQRGVSLPLSISA